MDLANDARVARSQLDEVFKEFQEAGQKLEFSPGLGVRLVRPVTPEPHLITRHLNTSQIGQSVLCFSEVDSTNDVAFDAARQSGCDGLVVLAESQRQGRGRRGRTWISPPGSNVLMSVLCPAGELLHEPLTLAAGVAAAESIEQLCGFNVQLKWPNDVQIDGKKLMGILVEKRQIDGRSAMVIGLGINVNAAPPDSEVPRPATCLAECVGHPVERVEVIRTVLQRLDVWYGRLACGDWNDLHEAWLRRCDMINERISVESAGRVYSGRVLDVSPLEGLILVCDHGQQVHLPAAVSSVLPRSV
jgi:BirA family biotin operon repressor/biotin-[acetyl-CoA-carboxylase] ligase